MIKYIGKQIFRHVSFPEGGEKKKKKKVSENNGQLRFRPPQRVAQSLSPGPECLKLSQEKCFFTPKTYWSRR